MKADVIRAEWQVAHQEAHALLARQQGLAGDARMALEPEIAGRFERMAKLEAEMVRLPGNAGGKLALALVIAGNARSDGLPPEWLLVESALASLSERTAS